MKYLIIITFFLIDSLCCLGQNDTSIVKKQKGFLFLSAYNYMYDYDGGHIKPLGFHDFFYPSSCIDIKCILDSNVNFIFKNGIRVDFFKSRKGIKLKGSSINCIDTSKCYGYNNFYVIPVELDYKLFEDYEPYICRRNFYEIQVASGSKLRFEYLHMAILPIKIVVLPRLEKKKK
jgi:hypothetical protein